ncbi:hypothetical protein E7Z59_05075 [Robertkochia marina]|uniref:Uncharacterized protein n=1 Tax=Robertkochia marina TaxID=1227945 RepID=A0A4S3M5Q8_9FLAO|nr:hypothetical protein [Robertkochia marina]THD69701.1 hypothetical protein E7Z59_05075 [Robertkochia marina]TRZ46955.1 hypothetical protein D3A96_05140 [Robertkochia marina]
MRLITTLLVCALGCIATKVEAQSPAPINTNYNQFDWNKAYQSQSFSYYKEGTRKDVSKVEGSPYFTPEFLKGEAIYKDTISKPYYIRYNAYMDEIEVKEGPNSDMVKTLLKDSKISAVIDGEKLKYIPNFADKNDKYRNGYLYVVYDGDTYDLFLRKNKEFREGVKAMTSFQSNFPDKFEDRIEYYVSVNNTEPVYLKLSRRGIMSIIEDDQRALVKAYIKENELAPDNQEELIMLMEYIENSL